MIPEEEFQNDAQAFIRRIDSRGSVPQRAAPAVAEVSETTLVAPVREEAPKMTEIELFSPNSNAQGV